MRGYGVVLPDSRHIDEFEIDKLYLPVPDKLHHISRR
jgi:hypothetical protein